MREERRGKGGCKGIHFSGNIIYLHYNSACLSIGKERMSSNEAQ